jgi:hypothetical protein
MKTFPELSVNSLGREALLPAGESNSFSVKLLSDEQLSTVINMKLRIRNRIVFFI